MGPWCPSSVKCKQYSVISWRAYKRSTECRYTPEVAPWFGCPIWVICPLSLHVANFPLYSSPVHIYNKGRMSPKLFWTHLFPTMKAPPPKVYTLKFRRAATMPYRPYRWTELDVSILSNWFQCLTSFRLLQSISNHFRCSNQRQSLESSSEHQQTHIFSEFT